MFDQRSERPIRTKPRFCEAKAPKTRHSCLFASSCQTLFGQWFRPITAQLQGPASSIPVPAACHKIKEPFPGLIGCHTLSKTPDSQWNFDRLPIDSTVRPFPRWPQRGLLSIAPPHLVSRRTPAGVSYRYLVWGIRPWLPMKRLRTDCPDQRLSASPALQQTLSN